MVRTNKIRLIIGPEADAPRFSGFRPNTKEVEVATLGWAARAAKDNRLLKCGEALDRTRDEAEGKA
jgi:hypothetical protein